MEVKLTKYKTNIHDIKKSKITNIGCNLKILYYLFILCFLCNLTNEKKLNSISKIILTIKGSGKQKVLSTDSLCIFQYSIPDEIIDNIFIIKF